MSRKGPDLAALWQAWPDTFAERCGQGRWVAYPWLQHISKRITPAIVRGGGRFVIEAPPQHGKSEFISNWVPTWFLNRFPDRKVILASYAADYAAKWGARVRENLTENEACQIQIRQDTHSKKRFVTSAGGQMITAGIGGQVTGEGAHLLIIDDPIKNQEEALSPRIRERNLDWYKSVARTRVQPGGTIILLMTRWADDDLAGELLDTGTFEEIRFPALCTDPATDPIGRAQGQALCPDRYDEQALAEIRRDVGETVWASLFDQSPVAKGGNIIHGDWIRTYDELPQLDEVALFADLAYKDGEENDYTVIEAWGRKGPNIYLISQTRARMDFPAQLHALQRMAGAYPMAFHKEIEEKANGAALIQVARQTIPGLIANNPKTSKEVRLAAVAPLYQAGNVYYPNPDKNPWVAENLREITRFPKGKHDDTCLAAGTMIATAGGQVPIEQIQAGDRVWTPWGLRRVLWAGQTGLEPCLEIHGIRGTGSHPIFCRNRGFVRMDAASMARIECLSWKSLAHWIVLRSWSLMVEHTGLWGDGKDGIILANQNRTMGEGPLRAFMSRSGKLIMARQFQSSIMFTTWTATRLITLLATWSVYRARSTIKHFLVGLARKASGAIWLLSERERRLGTGQRREGSGTKSRPGSAQPSESSIAFYARSAGGNLNLRIAMPGHVPTLAHKRSSIGTAEAVYNLTVQDAHAFYANGVLVGNCDVASMAVTHLGKVSQALSRLSALTRM